MNITVGRYPIPTPEERAAQPSGVAWPADTWQGWIEPDSREWIMFVARDGVPVVYLTRDETGAVLEPAT